MLLLEFFSSERQNVTERTDIFCRGKQLPPLPFLPHGLSRYLCFLPLDTKGYLSTIHTQKKGHTHIDTVQRKEEKNREMNSEAEHTTIPKLPFLFSVPPMPSPEHSGTITPPLHTLASVPFRWEEEPGKPRPCTALVPFSNNPTSDFPQKSLDLPPRLLFEAKLTKLLSPTSVLEGPLASSESFRSPSSFRMGGSFSDEKGRLGALVLNRGGFKEKGGGWFGSWRKKGLKVKREVSWGSYVFPSSADNRDSDDVGIIGEASHKMKRSGSFSSLSQAKSRVWTTISESLKQVIPWRIKKQKKGGRL